jgi:sec-independent protein translocase protein TatB
MVTPPIQMANLGMADSLILMVMALVVFGPRRLPQIGRQIGKLMYEFRKASNDFKFQMEEELRTSEDAERRQKDEERQRALVQPPAAVEAQPLLSATEAMAPLVPETQTIEAAPSVEATVPSAALELPSPDDGVYPAVTSPAADVVGEEPHLRIMPPSVGEQVPAARPTAKIVQAELFAEPAVDAPTEPGEEEPQAAHHG